jgi:hypothetical protein
MRNLSEKKKKALKIVDNNETVSKKTLAWELKEDLETSKSILLELYHDNLVYQNIDFDYGISGSLDLKDVDWERTHEEEAKRILIETTDLLFSRINVTELDDYYKLEFERHLERQSITKLEENEFIVEGTLNSVKLPKHKVVAKEI